MMLDNTILLSLDKTIYIINFGNNPKGYKGNCNVLFDEINEPECILTDLCIQGAYNPKDCNPVSKIPRPSHEVQIKGRQWHCWQFDDYYLGTRLFFVRI